jgi:hypothetical protein
MSWLTSDGGTPQAAAHPNKLRPEQCPSGDH